MLAKIFVSSIYVPFRAHCGLPVSWFRWKSWFCLPNFFVFGGKIKERQKKSYVWYIEGCRPERYISTTYHAWDTPFWSGTLNMYVHVFCLFFFPSPVFAQIQWSQICKMECTSSGFTCLKGACSMGAGLCGVFLLWCWKCVEEWFSLLCFKFVFHFLFIFC